MAVKSDIIKDGEIQWTLSNGDVEKLNEVMQKWNFKNHESFLRFATSVLLSTRTGVVGIIDITNDTVRAVSPQKELLKEDK